MTSVTEPYIPTTAKIREAYIGSQYDCMGIVRKASEASFDRWYVQEIEKAEYSGYLRAVQEGLHR